MELTASIFVNSTEFIGERSTIEINGNALYVLEVVSDKEIRVCRPIDVKSNGCGVNVLEFCE